jgi:hypothetical protein
MRLGHTSLASAVSDPRHHLLRALLFLPLALFGPRVGDTDGMSWQGLRMTCLVSASIWLAACSGDPAQNPAWDLAGHPGLLYWIRFYYEQNALEENGRCSSPLLEGVSRSEVLAEDDEQLVVRLTYRYRDFMRDKPRLPSGQFPLFRECRGFATRTFTIAKAGGELRVASMDGPQKRRRAPAPSTTQ